MLGTGLGFFGSATLGWGLGLGTGVASAGLNFIPDLFLPIPGGPVRDIFLYAPGLRFFGSGLVGGVLGFVSQALAYTASFNASATILPTSAANIANSFSTSFTTLTSSFGG